MAGQEGGSQVCQAWLIHLPRYAGCHVSRTASGAGPAILPGGVQHYSQAADVFRARSFNWRRSFTPVHGAASNSHPGPYPW